MAAGGQWTRREVPLTIGAELAHSDQKPGGLRFLLEVLFEEERQAFVDAVSAAADECAPVFCNHKPVPKVGASRTHEIKTRDECLAYP